MKCFGIQSRINVELTTGGYALVEEKRTVSSFKFPRCSTLDRSNSEISSMDIYVVVIGFQGFSTFLWIHS
jgi:hypothetical protein